MKRLRQWTLIISTALSLLLGLTTAAIWIRSYQIADSFTQLNIADDPNYDDWHTIACSSGGLQFLHEHIAWWNEDFSGMTAVRPIFDHDKSKTVVYPYFVNFNQSLPPPTGVRIAGIEYQHLHDADDLVQSVTFPLAIIVLPALFLPAARLRREIKRHRKPKANACPTCGYDLRATPTRCPECGTAPKKPINSN